MGLHWLQTRRVKKKTKQQQTNHQTDTAIVFKTFATSYQLYYSISAVYYTFTASVILKWQYFKWF